MFQIKNTIQKKILRLRDGSGSQNRTDDLGLMSPAL